MAYPSLDFDLRNSAIHSQPALAWPHMALEGLEIER